MCPVDSAGGPGWPQRSTTQQQQRKDQSMDCKLENEAMGIDDNDGRI